MEEPKVVVPAPVFAESYAVHVLRVVQEALPVLGLQCPREYLPWSPIVSMLTADSSATYQSVFGPCCPRIRRKALHKRQKIEKFMPQLLDSRLMCGLAGIDECGQRCFVTPEECTDLTDDFLDRECSRHSESHVRSVSILDKGREDWTYAPPDVDEVTKREEAALDLASRPPTARRAGEGYRSR